MDHNENFDKCDSEDDDWSSDSDEEYEVESDSLIPVEDVEKKSSELGLDSKDLENFQTMLDIIDNSVPDGYKIYTPVNNTSKFVIVDKKLRKAVMRIDTGASRIPGRPPRIKIQQLGKAGEKGVKSLKLNLGNAAKAAGKAGKALRVVNKVAGPVGKVLDVYFIGKGIYDSTQTGTSRNAVEAISSSAGGFAGGGGGAMAGAAVGTAIFPGVGTLFGAIIGGIVGGMAGQAAAEKVVEEISDAAGYGTEKRKCKKCGKEFINKNHESENFKLCPKCR